MRFKKILIYLMVFSVCSPGFIKHINHSIDSNVVNAAEASFCDGLYYKVQNNDTIEITSFDSDETKLVIPEIIDGKKVTRIGNKAFRDCTQLTEVIIPDSVTSIGNEAFQGCESLNKITIPGSVASIGNFAFSGTEWLSCQMKKNPMVIINGILIFADINQSVIEIPNSVLHINDNVFEGYEHLTEVIIHDSVTSIGYRAFYNCINLTEVFIPDSIISIKQDAFKKSDRFYEANKELTLISSEDSYAQKYANENYIKFAQYNPDNGKFLKGDIDLNGVIEITDLSELSLALIGDKTLTENQLRASDINENDKADLSDLARLRQFISKSATSLRYNNQEPDCYSFDLRSVSKYNELKDALKKSDDELDKFLMTVSGGFQNRSKAEKFIDLIDTHLVPDFITGNITWMDYSKGIIPDLNKSYEFLHIAVKNEDDGCVSYDFLFNSSQNDINYYENTDAAVKVFAEPLINYDGTLQIYAQTVTKDTGTDNYLITLYMNINDITVKMEYCTSNIEAFDINSVLNSTLVRADELEKP